MKLHPLFDFYRWAGSSLPSISPLDGASMPEPYRSLLVHDRDMTPTLEEFWGESIHLEPIQVREIDGRLLREVVLVTDETKTRAEFGAIKIYLERFAAAARNKILACRTPLGAILRDFEIPHESRPTGFFSVASDRKMSDALALRGSPTLYGRLNELYADRDPLAQVVEILPPLEEPVPRQDEPS